jgi:hypothetical protein
MIQGIILKGESIRIVLTGTDEIDSAVLKQLNGASVSLITENLRIGDIVISGGLIIEHERKSEKVVANSGERIPEGLHDNDREEGGASKESVS